MHNRIIYLTVFIGFIAQALLSDSVSAQIMVGGSTNPPVQVDWGVLDSLPSNGLPRGMPDSTSPLLENSPKAAREAAAAKKRHPAKVLNNTVPTQASVPVTRPGTTATDLNRGQIQTSAGAPMIPAPANVQAMAMPPANPMAAANRPMPVQPMTMPAPAQIVPTQIPPAANLAAMPIPQQLPPATMQNASMGGMSLPMSPPLPSAAMQQAVMQPAIMAPQSAPVMTQPQEMPQQAMPQTASQMMPATQPETATMAPTQVAMTTPPPPAPSQVVAGQLAPDDLRLDFAPGSETLSPEDQQHLEKLVGKMKTDPILRVELRSFASAGTDMGSKARRLSLSRALTVRSYLLDHGINIDHIDVRALGAPQDQTGADRVDLFMTR